MLIVILLVYLLVWRIRAIQRVLNTAITLEIASSRSVRTIELSSD